MINVTAVTHIVALSLAILFMHACTPVEVEQMLPQQYRPDQAYHPVLGFDATAYLKNQPMQVRYQQLDASGQPIMTETEGDAQPEPATVSETWQWKRTAQGRWQLIRERADQRREYYERSDGNWLLVGVEDLEHQSTTRYEPGLIYLPDDLEPGQTVESSAKIHLTRPKRFGSGMVEETGQITMATTFLARQKVRTPVGVYDCDLIEVTGEVDLPAAKVQSREQLYLHAEAGLVSFMMSEDVQAVGLLRWTKHYRILLDDKIDWQTPRISQP